MRRNAHAVSLFLALALAASGAANAAPARPKASKEDLSRARALDKEGARAYAEGRYADAVKAFEEAYRLGGPAFELWNIAKCYFRLDQPDQAADYLQRYLSIPNLPKADREEATQQLDSLTKKHSPLTVTSSPPGAQVTIDGKAVEGKTPLSATLPPGAHTVTVRGRSGEPYTQKVEAQFGKPVVVEASLAGGGEGGGEDRPPPPDNPYDESGSEKIMLRGALGIVLPRHGTIGGSANVGFLAMGAYKLGRLGPADLSLGGLLSITGDSWENRTNTPDEAEPCGALRDAHGATALSFFAIGAASFPILPKLRASGIAGLGLAGYFAGQVGGDLFVPTCNASPGVRPAMLFGAQLDYAITQSIRLTAYPLTWQLQPAFDGARAAPRDASGIWMRFGISLGAGVDF